MDTFISILTAFTVCFKPKYEIFSKTIITKRFKFYVKTIETHGPQNENKQV